MLTTNLSSAALEVVIGATSIEIRSSSANELYAHKNIEHNDIAFIDNKVLKILLHITTVLSSGVYVCKLRGFIALRMLSKVPTYLRAGF